MNNGISKIIVQSIAVFGGIVSTIFLIYSAQPWKSYAFDRASDYIFLSAVAIWNISPYCFIYFVFTKNTPRKLVRIVRAVAAISVLVVGMVTTIYNLFIHPDAQGGMMFIVLPAYHWMIIVVAVAAEMFRLNVGRK